MKYFKIEVISKKAKKIWGISSHIGKIIVDDFQEEFVMPLDSWKLEDYKKQWKEGLERLKKCNHSCLVSSVQNLQTPHPSIEMWTLYRKGDQVIVQQQLLIDETIAHTSWKLTTFSPSNCYTFINYPHKEFTEEGRCISSWHTNYKAVEAFTNSFEP